MMLPRSLTHLLAVAAVALLLAIPAERLSAQESEADLERQYPVSDLLRFLDARPRSLIADVGAGDGFFTVRIARAVGPNGRAVAVDISESALNELRERATRDQTANVDIVLGAPDDPRLAPGRFDAVLIVNAYHEMTAYEAMLGHIRAALKPGGRLLLVEPMHDTSRGLARDQQISKHDIEPGIVEAELKAARFDIVERDDAFITFTAVPGGFWLILARRN